MATAKKAHQGQTTFNHIDPDSPHPPTRSQIQRLLEDMQTDHRRSAEARGFEGEIFSEFGVIQHPGLDNRINGPPRRTGMILRQSGMKRGDTFAAQGARGDWTVQNNLLFLLWKEGNVFANTITLVRPLPGVTLVTTDDRAFPCTPADIGNADLKRNTGLPSPAQTVARHLLGICLKWGDWSPIPEQEFFRGLSAGEAMSYSQALHQLRKKDIVRLEKGNNLGNILIHMRPAFVVLFVKREKLPCAT